MWVGGERVALHCTLQPCIMLLDYQEGRAREKNTNLRDHNIIACINYNYKCGLASQCSHI